MAILSTAFLTQIVTESKSAQRSTATLEAFYTAQAGLNFAYAECYLSGWDWRTHDWSNGFVDADVDVHTNYSSGLNLGAEWDSDGYYSIPGYDFKVRAYREVDWTKVAQNDSNPYTGVIIIHSQGTDPDGIATSTLELRVSQRSMYTYFYFFPEDHMFKSGTYDGGGYGAIHVNGDIIFRENPQFVNISGLTAADYIRYYNWQYYAPYVWDDNDPGTEFDRDGLAPMPQASYPPYDYYGIGEWYATDHKFDYHAQRYPNFDKDAVSGSPFPLPKVLKSGADYEWNYDKYAYSQPADEQPVKFKVDNDVLAWMARKERTVSSDSRTSNPSYYLLTQEDQDAFNASPSTFDWDAWKTNLGSRVGVDLDVESDYEKKFWRARYNCDNTGDWVADADTATGFSSSYTYDGQSRRYYSINHEWWDDLTYGDDRATLTDDLAPAQSEVPSSQDVGGYFLNTEHQGQAWKEYVESQSVAITKSDTNETEIKYLSDVLKEANTGGEHITPMQLEVNYRDKADEGGVLFTKAITQDYLDWNSIYMTIRSEEMDVKRQIWLTPSVQTAWNIYINDLTQENLDAYIAAYNTATVPYQSQIDDVNQRIADHRALRPERYAWDDNPVFAEVAAEDSFVNVTRPAGSYEYYWNSNLFDKFYTDRVRETKILNIDVAKLKEIIDDGTFKQLTGHDFNGVLYVDNLSNESGYSYDFSVRLINGGVLPDEGLSLVTPHNIYVQGNFNLEGTAPEGGASVDARDYQAIQNYLNYHPTEGYSQDDFAWHPAALISTQRIVYTLSESFNDPASLPLSYNYWNKDTKDYYSYCLDDQVFLATYVPAPGSGDLPSNVQQFFTDHPEVIPPASWTPDWITTNLDPNKYPEANDLHKSLLNAGNANYKRTNDASMPNRVEHDVTYNTAIVSPYDPQGYIIERWYSEDASGDAALRGSRRKRNVVGAFIQLEDTYRAQVPLAYHKYNSDGEYIYEVTAGSDAWGHDHYAYFWQGSNPTNDSYYWPSYKYSYEINLADKEGSDGSQQASADFLAGAIGSWRKIKQAEF